MRFAITNNINNRDNINIALIQKTKDIIFNDLIQINNISITYSENLAPMYTDSIILNSNNIGIIEQQYTNNKFKYGVFITDRYITNIIDNKIYPLWYKYELCNAIIIDRIKTYKHIEYNVTDDKLYIVDIPETIPILNSIKIYHRINNNTEWEELSKNEYEFDPNTFSFKLKTSNYNGQSVLFTINTIDNKIIIKDKNNTIINIKSNNILIEGYIYDKTIISDIEYKNKYAYITILSNTDISGYSVTYNTSEGSITELINSKYKFKDGKDFYIDDNYDIITNKPNTMFYISFKPATSIMRIEKDKSRHDMPWYIHIPDNSININGLKYDLKERNIFTKGKFIEIKEPIIIADKDKIRLTYKPMIYRDIYNKPINIKIIEDNNDISNRIIDVNEKEQTIIIDDVLSINPNNTYVIYYTKFYDKLPIPWININPYKIYGEYNAMTKWVIIMLPENELTTNRSIFAIPVYNKYKYMDITTNNKTTDDVILKITNGDILDYVGDYVNTNDIHPIILGITQVLFAISPNDINYIDSRRLATDIAYDYEYDEYSDHYHINYTTVGWWWGRPIDIDNIAVVYIRKTTIEKMKELYFYYDYKTHTKYMTDPNFSIDSYIIENVIKPAIKRHLRVGAKLILEIVNE